MNLGLQLADFKDPQKVADWLRDLVFKTRRTVDGHLGFGDGTDPDNMFGIWKSYTTNAVANTEDAVAHSTGIIPIGYLVFTQDKAASLYLGGSTWTTTNIFLKCSVASVTVKIFIVLPSNKDV